jgi:thymidine phosphorylase
MSEHHHTIRPALRARRLGIDTYREHVVFMHAECEVCRSEGFESQARVLVSSRSASIPATLNVVTTDLLRPGEAGLSEVAWSALHASDGDGLRVQHMPPPISMSHIRAKVYGRPLGDDQFRQIVDDVVSGRLSSIEIAAFLTACAGDRLDSGEVASLTTAMLDVGHRLSWPSAVVSDKHCIGGLPGNRTTPIVVAIVAACGGVIPKTSSRAITSPAGTADMMETLAPVDLDLASMRRVVEKEGGCIVWGGSVALSPADDVLIRVERPLDLDSEGQLVASVLSKKAAAGSTHVVIDMPVGPTAKVRTPEAAAELTRLFELTAERIGLMVQVIRTDGTAPVGRGIGPALEARDVLAVLRRSPDAPMDLRERAISLAGGVLELVGLAASGTGCQIARQTLESGRAQLKFERICEAQGGMRHPPVASHTRTIGASASGEVMSIDNRRLARAAKLAGAPRDPAAGISLEVQLGEVVERGQPLFTLHAGSPGELEYAAEYVGSQESIIATGPNARRDESSGVSP